MHDLTAKRTLVKSPPELWSELSEVDRLARHLDAFGEIKITKLEPEHTVAWEGEGASGTVSIEPSGWGTKVTLTAQLDGVAEVEVEDAPVEEPAAPEEPAPPEEPVPPEEPAAETTAVPAPEAEAEEAEPEVEEPEVPEPDEAPEPVQIAPKRKRGFLAWLIRTRTSAQTTVAEPIATPSEPDVVETEPEPVADERDVAETESVAAEPDIAQTEPELVTAEQRAIETEPEPVAAGPDIVKTEPERASDPGLDPDRAQSVLDEVLDTLGSAHHRPFSRG
jgi:hypothetical protein